MSVPSINIHLAVSDERGFSARVEHDEIPAPLPSPHLTELPEDAALPRPILDPTSPSPGSTAPIQLGASSGDTTILPTPSVEVPGLPAQELGEQDSNLPKPY